MPKKFYYKIQIYKTEDATLDKEKVVRSYDEGVAWLADNEINVSVRTLFLLANHQMPANHHFHHLRVIKIDNPNPPKVKDKSQFHAFLKAYEEKTKAKDEEPKKNEIENSKIN